MAELLAIGGGSNQQDRFALGEGEELTLGRAPRSGYAVPWDRLISREHATLRLHEGRLEVAVLPTARNPVFYQGIPSSRFWIEPGDKFAIGDTTFYFEAADQTDDGDPLVAEHVLGDDLLTSERFSNPASCLHALCKMPELIAQSRDDAHLAEQVVDLLLDTIRGASASAVMQFDDRPTDRGRAGRDGPDREGSAPTADATLMRWDCRDAAVRRFRPSRRLIAAARKRQQSVVHLWAEDSQVDENFTINNDLDWAFCTPIPVGPGEWWCLYVTGQRRFAGLREVDSPQDLIGELRTAELVARFLGSVRQVRSLEQQHQQMRQFFSPAVIERLADRSLADALEPRSGPVSVLFCDVRGFSRKVEAAADLRALLDQVSHALSAMTRGILKYEGVIADFQGDAALGFWGWPDDNPDGPLLACRTAIAIHRAFADAQRDASSPLHGFRVGIGVGHGEAIAGRIGAMEQIKVGVFGPVVNLASRLQDLTKQVGVPILLDQATADAVRQRLDGSQPEGAALRRIGRFRPPGVESAVAVYTLDASDALSPDESQAYDAAVAAIEQGDWAAASELLQGAPADDPCSCFLRDLLRDASAPPDSWDGVLSIERQGSVRFKTTSAPRPG
ncbi:Adenylate cyclase 1 [Posidoniimonas polymericola]|uniref:Adenylate cyclase 1 n=1 Tax=Posidoniimonas polymericola TaxID=2528002 RepID=A0A5C5YR92_9BACT|nr:adenylate/guanylate cyclase domain-containing protein [Posidoniimonas polymericola]TWT77464.1 Adenylate cyclase 1 [Posidoniimonas polymericola]